MTNSNQAVITCPIFNVDTKVAHCTELRNKVWSGHNPGVRKGCQACIASNKCPITREFNKRGANAAFDHYVSAEPKKIKLRLEVLQEIRPVIVQEQHMNGFAITLTERDLISTANQRIDDAMGGASRSKASGIAGKEPTPRRRAATKPIEAIADQAAATGDLSAAINKAA